MRSALYYPHTEIKSRSLLKTALLMWDRLEFIVPYKGYKPEYTDKFMAEAVELFGVQRCPKSSEKKKAHDDIEELATKSLPSAFYYRPSTFGDQNAYELYPQKLLPETWDMLRELQIAGGALDNLDYPVAEAAGLSIMSILADSCAGKTRARITDRGSAYAVITNLLVDDQKTFESGYETVVSITLRAMNLSNVPIDNLISFRKREEKWGGYSLRSLRHSYIDKIESHLKLLSTVNGNASDKEEIDRQFEDDMDNDLRHLRQELRIAKQDVVFSKDVISTIIAAAGTIAALYYGIPYQLPEVFTLAGAPVMVGGVFSSRNKYATSRKSILQKHPMAYLHELNEFH